jgi:hypothetical protein
MAYTKLQFKPGIVRDVTRYSNNGGWFDSNRIRFRMGFPETIGGWTKLNPEVFLGACRSLFNWTNLLGESFIGAGTNLKFYIFEGNQAIDITPIRSSNNAVTFAATNGSNVITATDALHKAVLNDFVTISAADSLGGQITTSVLNKEHQISEIVDANSYKFVVSATANSSDVNNGGTNAKAKYQINTGLASASFGAGWGAGVWGGIGTGGVSVLPDTTGWGDPSNVTIPSASLRLWSQDNFGEDLIINVRNGGIFYWDTSSGVSSSNRAVALSTLTGAQAVPTVAAVVLVSEKDRHVIAFGCDPETNSGTQDPLTIRFSSQESATEWRTLDTNTAGELQLSSGNGIITAVQTKQQILVLTDISAHAMQYVGDPFVYGISEVSRNISVAGQNAAVAIGDAVYWMGRGQFYIYNGNVKEIPCSVKEYVFTDLNIRQQSKVIAGSNTSFSEVWWFYPSLNSENNDRYVVFNYAENIWYYGILNRTAWIDNTHSGYPIAASIDGHLYTHEFGTDDGSTSPASNIGAFIESGPIELSDGNQFMFGRKLLPDISFRNSTSTGTASAELSLSARNSPGGSAFGTEDNTLTGQPIPVGTFTEEVDIRIRGRSVALKLASIASVPGVSWRLGTPRIDVRPDGRR